MLLPRRAWRGKTNRDVENVARDNYQLGCRPEEEEHHPFEVDGQTSKEAAALTLGEVGD
jgi:hypothetical protein